MRVMVIIKGTPDWEAGLPADEHRVTAMAAFNEDLVKAGVLLDGKGLHPSSKGVRVRYSGAVRTVTDGPSTDAKELVAGYWLWQVHSIDEAIEWARRCPNPKDVESEIEIRPVMEEGDLGPELTPETRALEVPLRDRLAVRSRNKPDPTHRRNETNKKE